eukprot:11185739-Lingulodinium_polyedra.AAC.1
MAPCDVCDGLGDVEQAVFVERRPCEALAVCCGRLRCHTTVRGVGRGRHPSGFTRGAGRRG